MSSEEEARERLTAVGKGSFVRVYKGRKVPVGVEGYVFWLGDGQYGPRVGLTTLAGETHWVSTANVAVVLPGLRFHHMPPEGWEKYESTLKRFWSVYAQDLPQKGERVLAPYPRPGGFQEAEVVWTGYTKLTPRIGAKVLDPEEEKTMWYSIPEVRQLDGSGWPEGPFPRRPLKGICQPPFDRACRVVREFRDPEVHSEDAWRLLDHRGNTICKVPASTAQKLTGYLDRRTSQIELI
jgi:hypothetical protein